MVYDRFSVEGLITAPEAIQALTEAGLIAPRRYVNILPDYRRIAALIIIFREMAQYLRTRKFFGTKRNITFFEYIRAFAALR